MKPQRNVDFKVTIPEIAKVKMSFSFMEERDLELYAINYSTK